LPLARLLSEAQLIKQKEQFILVHKPLDKSIFSVYNTKFG